MEPETNTLTPDVTEKKRSNTPLYIIFGFLLAAIIALVIVIVVVNTNNKQAAITKETEEEAAKNGTSTNAEALAAAGWTNAEQLAKINTEKQALAEIRAQAQEQLNKNPNNIESIIDTYKNYYNNALDNEKDEGKAMSYFSDLVDLLIKNDMKKDALDLYELFPLERLSGINKLSLYDGAVQLATELADTEKISRYRQKVSENFPAWEEEERAIQERNKKRNEYLQSLSRGDKTEEPVNSSENDAKNDEEDK